MGGTPAAAIVERLSTLDPGTAVDLGCGDGRHARLLAQEGWDVAGVDLSQEAITQAQNHDSLGSDIVYTVGDVRSWVPLYDQNVSSDGRFKNGKFDLVLAAICIFDASLQDCCAGVEPGWNRVAL